MNKQLGGIRLPPGKYIIAVSGGVDSMTLLDLLRRLPEIKLIVAHFNHGIRPGSAKDEKLVVKIAKAYKLDYEVGYGQLGAGASEETARTARYKFLEEVKKKHQAESIITAHHQDDLIETAILNVVRGTGPRGLSAIMDNPKVLRPLINTPKKAIESYALKRKLEWANDSSNNDDRYLRNYVRARITPGLSQRQRGELLGNIDIVANSRSEIENLTATLSHYITNGDRIDRSEFAALPTELAYELMAYWLRTKHVRRLDRRTVERLSLGIKTAKPNTELVINNNLKLFISTEYAHFSNR